MALPSLHKQWKLQPVAAQQIESLQAVLKIHPALCTLLALRGLSSFDEAKHFFRPQLQDLHDPFLMKGMLIAVQRIEKAIASKESILVYGDYDVDGTTAVSVVYSFLKKHYQGPLDFYIPHRYREGYGISKQGVDYAKEKGFGLMITLDCGIKSVELIRYAQSLGIDVIVCDHHLPDTVLPPALAILNPKQGDCNYPYKELSGCGIGFKLISALAQQWHIDFAELEAYLDLVATSIASDIVPVDGENRVLAFYGIEKINTNPCPSIKALMSLSGVLDKKICLSDLVFVVGPKINAAGRMDDARKVVELFIEQDLEKIKTFAQALMVDNSDRKQVDKNITEEALQLLENDPQLMQKKSTVLYQEHWHKGVVGIVASRLIEHCYRPTIVLAHSNGKVSGSARSVLGFNVYEAIDACADLLENYGGHFYAAGLTMTTDNYPKFVEKFEQVVAARISPEMLFPTIFVDAVIQLEDITMRFYNIVQQFEPFGPSNMRPIFCTLNLRDFQNSSRVLKEQHIKFVLSNTNGTLIEGIGFNMADKYPLLQQAAVNIVYTIDLNEFNGKRNLQLRVIDLKPFPEGFNA